MYLVICVPVIRSVGNVYLRLMVRFEPNEFTDKIFVCFPTHSSYLNDTESTITRIEILKMAALTGQ